MEQKSERNPEQMSHRKVAEFLFKLLDDIDTLRDMAKGNDAWYIAAVETQQAKRWEVATSEGDTVRFVSDIG